MKGAFVPVENRRGGAGSGSERSGGEGPAVLPVHFALPGRLRLKVRGLRHSPSLQYHLESGLAALPGVHNVATSTLTGTVLVEYERDVPATAVCARVRELIASPPAAEPAAIPLLPRLHAVKTAPPKPASGSLPERAWHRMEGREVLKFFATSADTGLSADGYQRHLARFGANILPETPPRSGWEIFQQQFRSLPVYLLGASAALSVATGGIADAVVILAVVGINATIGYLTESRAEGTIHSLRRLVRPSARVRREGETKTVRAEDVVPGDLLLLRPGDYVTADCRLLESHHLSVDESVLTGESLPVAKQTAPLRDREIPLGDRVNMAFTGTYVTGGQGVGIVVGTRDRTEIGRIQSLMKGAEAPTTPMSRELDHIGNRLVGLSGGISAAVFVLGLLRGQGLLAMLRSSISLAIAAIPEGLPTVATTVLAIGIGKMERQRVLIRRLDAVETLGAVQTVCLDKTGTLTLNRMTVTVLQAGGERLQVNGGEFTCGGQRIVPLERSGIGDLLRITALCSETEVVNGGNGTLLNGSSTENSLVEVALAAGVDVIGLRAAFPMVHSRLRSERRQSMRTVHRVETWDEPWSFAVSTGNGNPRRLIAVKGNPTEVLARCTGMLRDGREATLDEEGRHRIEMENESMAGEGLRVLGVAMAALEGEESRLSAERGLVWLGLVGMADPVRPGVQELIARFHRAGVDTVMITGDQVPTAYAIGRELHLQRDGKLEIFESTRLGEVDPEILGSLAQGVQIFARVSPAQKLQIVHALQRGGRVVAMTGDGINDGPALKAADIGIAMGRSGTDLAREVGDVVIEDDRLETLMTAIAEGRSVYLNIGKSIRFLLATNFSEILVMFAAVAAGQGHLLTPMQLLWINLISDIFPGLALSLEPPEPDILHHPPQDRTEPILSPEFLRRSALESAVIAGGALSAYGYGLARYGSGARAGTVGFLSLVSAQLLHTFACRSEKPVLFGSGNLPPNPWIGRAVGGTFLLQLLALAVPGLRRFLGLAPVTLLDSAVIGGTALLPLFVNEAIKDARQKGAP